MRASGAKGCGFSAIGWGRHARAGFAAIAACLLSTGTAFAEPCQTIADAIASQAEWQAHDIVDLADPFESVRGIDEIRTQLQSIDPALLEAPKEEPPIV